MIVLILAGLLPSVVLGLVVGRIKRSWIKGTLAGAMLQGCWAVAIITLLILNGDPPSPGARTITKEEMNQWKTNPEPNIGPVSSEAAPSASPDEPSM